MSRPITLFTGQWADLKLEILAEKMASFGYDGLELACWGEHFDILQAANSKRYCQERRDVLKRFGLDIWAISNHLVGQATCDRIDTRHKAILPIRIWGDGDPGGVRKRAAEEMKLAAKAAANLGINVVVGFTGSPIWHLLYSFPPNDPNEIQKGYKDFADIWNPILDVFEDVGVRFALEVHPTEIAYDIVTSERVLKEIDYRDCFGFNFDPSHLFWQMIDPDKFIESFPDRIYHVHIKDVAITTDGRNSILSSHLNFGEPRRGWDFRSPGRGDIDFELIIRSLNRIGYKGPLSVEWEDVEMNREHGAKEACQFIKELDFEQSKQAFDKAFGSSR